MEIYIISIVAFIASILTFFSGFGLGTLLTPVFLLFFPVEIAITLTAFVHFFNNIAKVFLVYKNLDKQVFLKFGISAIFAAILGSWVLLQLPKTEPLYSYELFEKVYNIITIKLIIGIVLFWFSLMDIVPALKKIQFSKDKLFIGGLLSGFFGGLSGNQGALRSAFLIKAGLSKESFIATGVIISIFIDISRISVYMSNFKNIPLENNWPLLIIATTSAIIGAIIGNKLLKKITIQFIQIVVAIFLLIISLSIVFGII